MTCSITGRLINLFHRCDGTIRLESLKLTDEVRVLEQELATLRQELKKGGPGDKYIDQEWRKND